VNSAGRRSDVGRRIYSQQYQQTAWRHSPTVTTSNMSAICLPHDLVRSV